MTGAPQAYQGNCHCGAYRFEITVPTLTSAVSCNCSLCHKLAALWVFPLTGDFKVTKGDETSLVDYSAGAASIKFCATCGITTTGSHRSGPLAGKFAVNARTLLDVNPYKLEVETADSKSSETPIYEDREFQGQKPVFESEDLRLYTGSCHCGAVAFALKSKPLDQAELKEDNCSICVRRAWTGIYPRKGQVSLEGSENTTDYVYGRKFSGSPFCSTCGIHVHSNLYGPPKHIVDTWPEARQAMVKEKLDLLPLNLRTFHGIDLSSLPVNRSDEGTEGYVLD